MKNNNTGTKQNRPTGQNTEIILASKSPRRRELFSLITDNYDCTEANLDESLVTGFDAWALCFELAKEKCLAVTRLFPENAVVGCDTVVEINGEIIGKPHSPAQARSMINKLSGNRHTVYTGVYIKSGGDENGFVCRSVVEFFPVPEAEIEAYIKTEEPYDKAGAYGIQGWAARFIKGIDGDYYNVMGLPVSRLYNLLREMEVI